MSRWPSSARVLVFDCETTTHPGQALRFGAYQLRNAGELVEGGVFYDPEGVDSGGLDLLTRYAAENRLVLWTRQSFVDDVFFGLAWQLRATIVGFNLPFDISRLALAHGTARTPLDGEGGGMRGAFTFRLSDQKIYPNVRIKHMSRAAALISFAATMRQPDGRGHRSRGMHTPTRRGHFLDVKTLATALFSRSFTLGSLSRFLQVPSPKLDFDEFDGQITDDMVRYAVRDVQATWECYAELTARFAALKLTPGPIQPNLRPVDIAGKPEYRVDPTTTDFFKRVIELRQSVKRRMKTSVGTEREQLDTEQNSLKICANSTSYGIWIEVNVETRPQRKPTTVLSSTRAPFSFQADKAEMPGTFFHPLLGTLITGAARLMLAITERLITDKCLDWAFCDTDSMALAKPDNMTAGVFAERTAEVVQWFEALNPYQFGGSILKVEDVNGGLATGEPEPLYCYAISSKRYCLFNLTANGTPIMRKISAHGLGHLLPPYTEADAPVALPVPDRSVLRDGTARWHCDLWHHIVVAALNGHPDRVALDYHPALRGPAISRYHATSPELLAWFRRYNADRSYRDQVKPFNFLTAMTAAFRPGEATIVAAPKRGRPKRVGKLAPVAPFDRNPVTALASAFDRNTGEPVAVSELKSYAEALTRYHLSPEAKFLNGNFLDRGATVRRHVYMIGAVHIGKESHDWERQANLGLKLTSGVGYGTTAVEPDADGGSDQDARTRVLKDAVVRDGLRATARRLKVDASNLRRRLNGKNGR